MSIIQTDEFQRTLRTARAMASSRRLSNALFITGGAGVGKTTLIHLLRKEIKDSVVIAPTGVAATVVGGSTIHRVFNFPFKPLEPAIDRENSYPSAILRKAKAIIVDESGMVRADIVDGMDYYLRRANRRLTPFGGVPMIFVGDSYQIPPVLRTDEKDTFKALGYENRHFFGAKVWREFGLETIHLTKVFRQENEQFAGILSRMRSGALSVMDMAALNAQVGPAQDENTVTLTPTRRRADEINSAALARLPAREETYEAKLKGDFGDGEAIAERKLVLREGAFVMLLNNNADQGWVNGSTGIYEGRERSGELRVRLANGRRVLVDHHKWERFRYRWDATKGAIDQVKLGEMLQYPVKIAWAVTIHKGQGQTLDRCHVDFGNGMFDSGQAYVALSRVRTLEGLSLSRPLTREDCIVDPHVQQFFASGCVPTLRQTNTAQEAAEQQRRTQLALFA